MDPLLSSIRFWPWWQFIPDRLFFAASWHALQSNPVFNIPVNFLPINIPPNKHLQAPGWSIQPRTLAIVLYWQLPISSNSESSSVILRWNKLLCDWQVSDDIAFDFPDILFNLSDDNVFILRRFLWSDETRQCISLAKVGRSPVLDDKVICEQDEFPSLEPICWVSRYTNFWSKNWQKRLVISQQQRASALDVPVKFPHPKH